FVGRQSEREQLRRCLEQAVRGQGSLVLLSGEPGVGKSRLAEQVAVEARDQEVLVLSGHCYEMEMLPYAPFVEILDTTTRSMDRAALQVALGEGAGEVARMLPSLRKLFPDAPAPLDLPPERERHYLFSNVLEFLERGGRERPLLLVMSETEGNPFFIEEVFKYLLEEKKLVDDSGQWLSEVIASELDVPEGVRLVIARRLQRLSDDCHRLLTAAAVIGYNFTFDLL